jgi:hypothetical protein
MELDEVMKQFRGIIDKYIERKYTGTIILQVNMRIGGIGNIIIDLTKQDEISPKIV